MKISSDATYALHQASNLKAYLRVMFYRSVQRNYEIKKKISLHEFPVVNGMLTFRFPKIPPCVYELENLEILLATENKITEINVSSDALSRLKKLAVLDLSNNSIAIVPPELGNFKHLR